MTLETKDGLTIRTRRTRGSLLLRWEAEVLTTPDGRFGSSGYGMTRRGAIRDAVRRYRNKVEPWELVS